MIAVMGAAGNVGSKVTDLLLREGQDVRVLEHQRTLEEAGRRGAEVVTGDATNAEDLQAVFKDADAALVLLPDVVTDPRLVATRSRMSRAIADALRGARVGHVVALSVVGADRADAAGPPAGLHELERRLSELKDSNLMVLRSCFYMENLLANLPLIRSRRLNGSAIGGDLAFPMIATHDVALQAAERLRRRDFTGHRVKLLLGPEDVSMRDATRAIGERLGLPYVAYVKFSPADVKAALLGAGMSEEAALLMVEMQLALDQGRPFDAVQRTADAATPTRLDEFLKGCSGEGVSGAARTLPRGAAAAGPGGLRRGPSGLERRHRPAAGADRPLRRRRRRRRRRAVRPRA
jgi:uncharacterized protein YbjT (DUF2867 family)